MSYSPIVLPADLNNIYPEILDEITRDDHGTLATEAIDTAIQEIKMYLTRYDLLQLFGDIDNDKAAIFHDAYLTRIVKDIAVWHLLHLANPSINYEVCKGRYEEHINALKLIQKGIADPRWPYNDPTGETAPPSDSVLSIQSDKRNNTY